MKQLFVLASCLTLLTAAPRVSWGHGTPIIVNVNSGKLTVSNGIVAADGYANWMFADPDPESWFTPISAVEQLTELPGFNVNDMLPGEALSLEVIARPDLTAANHPQRWLWHWNLATQQVAVAPNDPSLELASQRGFSPGVVLQQGTTPANATVKLANVLSGDLGAHRHLLAYFLDDAPAAPAGVYGFFARLLSPSYKSSEPFFIALNLNVFDASQFQAAARQINLAAGLAADFDVDGDVDGGDFLQWQRQLGVAGIYPAADASLNGLVDADDLAVWREQFGRTVDLPAGTPASMPIPEPALASYAAILVAAWGLRRGCRG